MIVVSESNNTPTLTPNGSALSSHSSTAFETNTTSDAGPNNLSLSFILGNRIQKEHLQKPVGIASNSLKLFSIEKLFGYIKHKHQTGYFF